MCIRDRYYIILYYSLDRLCYTAALILLYLDAYNAVLAGDFILDYIDSLDRTLFNDSDEAVVDNKRYWFSIWL